MARVPTLEWPQPTAMSWKFVRRIYIMPLRYLLLLAVLLAGLGFFLAAATTTAFRGEVGSLVFLGACSLIEVYLIVVVWRSSHVAVSSHGVSLPTGLGVGLVKRRWLSWDDIEGFEREEPSPQTALAPRIVARTKSGGELVAICGIPFQPLLLDSRERHNLAARRVLRLIEAEQMTRSGASTDCAPGHGGS
jgi:hypothetical protein